MKIRHTCAYMLIASGILLFTGGAVQAQLGSGTGSGGVIGQGSPDITKPGKGGDATRGGSGSPNEGTMKPGHESSGTMGSEGAIINKPRTGGEGTPGGSGRLPDSSTTNPGASGGSGSGSGSGSGGGMGSSGGAGGGGK